MTTAILIGSANSARITLERLHAHGVTVAAVFGQRGADGEPPPGRVDLAADAERAGAAFTPFSRIADHADEIAAVEADIAFVVGISQIVDTSLFERLPLGAVGFHPTRLPRGRGRAPLAWLALGETPGAATFFRLGDGADDGAVIVQEPFDVETDDTSTSLSAKVGEAARVALDRWLPNLERGVRDAEDQDESRATWLGARRPEDGRIDWNAPAEAVVALVRASAHPYPGAFTYLDEHVVSIDRAEVCERPIVGVPGRILDIEPDGSVLIAAGGRTVVRVRDWASPVEGVEMRVGRRLGLDAELAVVALRDEIRGLEERLNRLERSSSQVV